MDLMLESYKNAEVGLLGSVLIDAESCISELSLFINADDFAHAEFKTIWNIIEDLHAENEPIDIYVVKSRAGDAYTRLIETIADYTPTSVNWKIYAKEVKRHAKLFKVNEVTQKIAKETETGTATDLGIVRGCAEELVNILESCDNIKNEFTFDEMFQYFMQNAGKKKEPLNFGMSVLNDNIMCEAGDYVLIGATPSVGKTCISLQFAISMAESGKNVMYFSYETTQAKLMERIISCQGHINYQHIKRQEHTEEWAAQAVAVGRRLHRLPFTVVEAAGMTVDNIRSRAIKGGADVVFIDYIQQVAHPDSRLNEFQRVTEVSRGIQHLCQKYKITTIALSQCARIPDGKKPTLSSFRSSGQLEQDINIGILFYRPEELQEGEEDHKRIFDIAKNKDGKKGMIRMWFDGDYQTFSVVDDRR